MTATPKKKKKTTKAEKESASYKSMQFRFGTPRALPSDYGNSVSSVFDKDKMMRIGAIRPRYRVRHCSRGVLPKYHTDAQRPYPHPEAVKKDWPRPGPIGDNRRSLFGRTLHRIHKSRLAGRFQDACVGRRSEKPSPSHSSMIGTHARYRACSRR